MIDQGGMTLETKEEKERRAPSRQFPRHTLEEAIAVPKAIQDKNAGKPWKPIFVAEALGIKPQSSNFQAILSSSARYGLTQGSWGADYISLTPLGVSITKPTDPQKVIGDLQQAIMNVELFKKIFNHYKDGKFPSSGDSFFKNTLETEFSLPKELVDPCIDLLIKNGKFASIFREVQGSTYVVLAEIPAETPQPPKVDIVELVKPTTAVQLPSPPSPKPQVANQIFVAHGRNKIPLEQLKKILTEFKIPFKVAVDEPNMGRPIPQKVADLMQECTSAIVIFTADETYTHPDGSSISRPSDNAVYELGAASILYGNKIVILKEDTVSLATDFGDLGYISFEKDKLDAKTMDLMKELIGFGLLKVTPA